MNGNVIGVRVGGQSMSGQYVVIALLMLLHQSTGHHSPAPHHPSYQWPDAPVSVYRLLHGHNVALSPL